jgi:4-amino-4-deoxy-L-arabinose transferase-like glycosyltransferase
LNAIVNRFTRLLPALLMASVLVASAAVLFRSAQRVAFHGDESGWIASGLYYSDLVLSRDFTWEKWRCRDCYAWGSLNPQLGKLMIGLPLRISSSVFPSLPQDDFGGYYDFDRPFDQNVAQGRVPPVETLMRARRTSVVLGVLCCLLIFGIGYLCDSPWTAVSAAGLLLLNPLFLETASRVLTDIHYSTFLLSLCVVSVFLLKARRFQDVLVGSALCGLLAGLACSVKVTGIVVGGCYFLVIASYRYFVDGTGRLWFTSSLAIFGVSSILTIYASNPYYWPSAADFDTTALAAELRDVPAAIGNNRLQPPTQDDFPHVSRLLAFPLLFLRWQKLMTAQQSRPSAAWNGNRAVALQKELFWRYVSFRWELPFLLIGVIVCAIKIVDSINERRVHPLAVPLVYFGVNYVFISLFMKLNWGRYYLPTVIAGRVLIAVGIVYVVRFGAGLIRQAASLRP